MKQEESEFRIFLIKRIPKMKQEELKFRVVLVKIIFKDLMS